MFLFFDFRSSFAVFPASLELRAPKMLDEIELDFQIRSGLIASFPGHRVLRPEDACPERFSWFFYWIPKVQKEADILQFLPVLVD